jgi:hypothetical protein
MNPFGLVAAIYRRWSQKQQRVAAACAEFRQTFHQELAGLYPRPSEWPRGTGIEPRLRKSFPGLQAAVATFRPFVPDHRKSAFDYAWLVYRTSTKREIDEQDYTHYMNFGSETTTETGWITRYKQNGRANFRRNVDRLLEFAGDWQISLGWRLFWAGLSALCAILYLALHAGWPVGAIALSGLAVFLIAFFVQRYVW